MYSQPALPLQKMYHATKPAGITAWYLISLTVLLDILMVIRQVQLESVRMVS